MKPKGNWSRRIRETLEQFNNSPGTTIGDELHGGEVSDVTAESVELLRDFAPDVKILGWQLKSEKKHFGGVHYRAVKNEDDSERCLQYIYVYTKQLGAVSLLWMVFVPILMGIWGMFILQNFDTEITLLLQAMSERNYARLLPFNIESIPLMLTGGVWLPILLAGFAPHVGDYFNMPKGRWFYARSTTLLIPFGIMQWLVVFNSLVPIILFVFGGACAIYYSFEWLKITKSAHDMDYAPVFVWITKRTEEEKTSGCISEEKRDSDYWKFKSACWDYYHYSGVTKDEEDMTRSWGPYTSKYLKDDKRVRLLMDNTWHSFFLGSQITSFFRASVVVFPLLIFTAFELFTSSIYTDNYPTTVWMFAGLCFLAVLTGRTAARYPFSLVDDWNRYIPSPDEDPEQSETYWQHYLTPDKLSELWNLKEKQARFVIISKMQNPFHIRSDFYDTFRDEPEYLLYDYGVTTRLNRLEQELAETNLLYARELIDNQRYDDAEKILKRSTDLKPDFIQAWTVLGDLYIKTGQPDKADDLFRKIREERPELSKPWFAYGVTLEKMGNIEQAQEVYAEAVEIESRRAGRVQSFRQMVEVNPEVPEVWEALGKFLDMEGKEKEAEEAKKKAEKAKMTRSKK